MSDWQPDGFDAQLRSALHARPEPAAPSNLAHRAVELARFEQRAAAQQLARIQRLQRFNRLITAAAVLLVMVALYLGGRRAWQRASDFLADQTSGDDTTSSTVASGSSSDTFNGMFLAVLAIGACATVVVLTHSPEGDDATMLRFG